MYLQLKMKGKWSSYSLFLKGWLNVDEQSQLHRVETEWCKANLRTCCIKFNISEYKELSLILPSNNSHPY